MKFIKIPNKYRIQVFNKVFLQNQHYIKNYIRFIKDKDWLPLILKNNNELATDNCTNQIISLLLTSCDIINNDITSWVHFFTMVKGRDILKYFDENLLKEYNKLKSSHVS